MICGPSRRKNKAPSSRPARPKEKTRRRVWLGSEPGRGGLAAALGMPGSSLLLEIVHNEQDPGTQRPGPTGRPAAYRPKEKQGAAQPSRPGPQKRTRRGPARPARPKKKQCAAQPSRPRVRRAAPCFGRKGQTPGFFGQTRKPCPEDWALRPHSEGFLKIPEKIQKTFWIK